MSYEANIKRISKIICSTSGLKEKDWYQFIDNNLENWMITISADKFLDDIVTDVKLCIENKKNLHKNPLYIESCMLKKVQKKYDKICVGISKTTIENITSVSSISKYETLKNDEKIQKDRENWRDTLENIDKIYSRFEKSQQQVVHK